jgi:hypothetical protein
MNLIIVKWIQIYTKGITISTSTIILTFAEDKLIIAYSEDNFKIEVFTLFLKYI